MNILLISDQTPASEHSAVEGIFNGALRRWADVTVTYFDRHIPHVERLDKGIVLPHRYKHKRILPQIRKILPDQVFDLVIVRNYFPVLKHFLASRMSMGYKVGFWESFPHDFRRFYEARVENKALWRKTLEFHWRRGQQLRRLSLVDFYLPVTRTFKDEFHPTLEVPWNPLPLGFDFTCQPPEKSAVHGPLHFVYTGTVDHLRRLNEIVTVFNARQEDFIFDIFTSSDNPTVRAIAKLNDRRIRVQAPLPREKLFARLVDYDIGIGLIPDNKLYRVASPTKTLEFCALGLAPLVNHLPEYETLFDDNCAFFCEFAQDSLHIVLDRIFSLSREAIRKVGENSQQVVVRERDYQKIAMNLWAFLKNICG